MDQPARNLYNRARLDDRLVTELIGIARGITADGEVTDGEVHFLRKWLAATEGVIGNPILVTLSQRIEEVLADGVIDPEEREDLIRLLNLFVANDFEAGEALKSSALPLCDPMPDVIFDAAPFCFTGTFAFGSRRDCENAVTERGGIAGSLTKKTRFLVIGEYATESWSQSVWGRKVEKAVTMRSDGLPISIVDETHWRRFVM